MIRSSEQTTWRSRIRPLAFCSIYPSSRSARSWAPWAHPRRPAGCCLMESIVFTFIMPVSHLIGVVLRPSNDHRGRTRGLGGPSCKPAREGRRESGRRQATRPDRSREESRRRFTFLDLDRQLRAKGLDHPGPDQTLPGYQSPSLASNNLSLVGGI